MRFLLIRDLLSGLKSKDAVTAQRSHEHLDWINSDLVNIVNEFVEEKRLLESSFIINMNRVFRTKRFEQLLKKWIVEYFLKLFRVLDGSLELTLEDNPINRFGVEKYYRRFNTVPEIKWKRRPNLLQKISSILARPLVIIFISLKNGIKFNGKRKRYKVMREALWGLYDVGGHYFHDDFMVDGEKIKKEDLLLFSRGIPAERSRLKGYYDARKSSYGYFNLSDMPIGLGPLFSRVIPKYIISSGMVLLKEIYSNNFSLYWSIYLYFLYNALPYEKVFSSFEVTSELGHSFFSTGHIAEAIVCQNYGTRYYFIHWSDNSVSIDKYIFSFLGCDAFLLWGKAYIQGVEGGPGILVPIGYPFKRFVRNIISNREKTSLEMGIKMNGKIITFFDESFGGECKMGEESYVVIWETALKLAEREADNTILIKPKDLIRYNNLSPGLKERFIYIKNKMEKMPNVHIIDSNRWSFIETIGISDIVVTQGMTSSATIAIICGIEGLYLDQSGYKHLFSKLFKDKIVFDNPDRLLDTIRKIALNTEHALGAIPEDILRAYDAYPDDRGIDLLRDMLTGGHQKKRIGIVVQARMGSTRLPGKIMRPISGRPMLEILVERLKKVKKSDILIIATTRNKNDDAIEKLTAGLGVHCFRGDEEDVLGRYYEAAKEYGLDIIVRITSDCPLMDPELVDKLIEAYLNDHESEFMSNTVKRMFPRGFDIEVFDFYALEKTAKNATKRFQREHVTPYMLDSMKKRNYDNTEDTSVYRLTVDTIEDFELIANIFGALKDKPDFGYSEVMELLKKQPELLEINKNIIQKEICNERR